jgi:hypothetical protein
MEKIFGKSGLEEVRKGASDALERYVRQCCDRNVRAINVNKEGTFENLPDEGKLKEYIDFCEAQDILPEGFYGGYQARIKDAKGQQKWLIEADKQAERRGLEDGFRDFSGRVRGFPTYRKLSMDSSNSGRLSRAEIYCFNLQRVYDRFVELLESSAKYLSEHPEHRDMLGLAAGETFRVIEGITRPLLADTENRTGDLFVEGVGNVYDRMWKLFDLPFSKEGVILGELYELAEKNLRSQERKLDAESAKLSERRQKLSESRAALGI